MRTLDGDGGGGGGGEGSGGGARAPAHDGSAEGTLRDGPALSRFVVARAARDLAGADWLDGDEPVAAGALYILSYSRVRNDVVAGHMELT